jgi:hypothetical protein
MTHEQRFEALDECGDQLGSDRVKGTMELRGLLIALRHAQILIRDP